MIFNIQNNINILSKKYGKKLGIDLSYFIKSGFWMTLRQGTEITFGLLLLMFFTRYTSKEVFGQYQLVISIFSIISILSLPGINTAVMRSAARGEDGDYEVGVRNSFFWSLLGIPALLIVGVYYYFLVNQTVGIILMTSSIFFPFFYAPDTWSFFLQGKKLYRILFGFNATRAILNTAVTAFVIVASKGSIIPIIITYFSSYSFFSVFYYFKTKKYIQNNLQDPDMINYGKFITKVSVFNVFAENADKILISFMLSVSDIAVFSIISMVAVKLRGFFNPIFSITFPKMVSYEFDFGKMWRDKKGIFLILFLLAIIPGVIFYFLIEKINLLFFGNGYSNYYVYSKIFVIFTVLSLPISLSSTYVVAKKMTRALMYARPVYFVIKVVISVIFIHFWGLLGVIWAYNISAVVLFILYCILIRQSQVDQFIRREVEERQ